MSEPDWYLLFGGSSVDGRGPGEYIGRTTSKEEALKHFKSVAADPYSVGHVHRVTDSKSERIYTISQLT